MPSDDVPHLTPEGKTPTAAPGVTTVSTAWLAGMLEHDKPLVIDTMSATWYRSVPAAVGLDFNEPGYLHGNANTYGTFTDEVQKPSSESFAS